MVYISGVLTKWVDGWFIFQGVLTKWVDGWFIFQGVLTKWVDGWFIFQGVLTKWANGWFIFQGVLTKWANGWFIFQGVLAKWVDGWFIFQGVLAKWVDGSPLTFTKWSDVNYSRMPLVLYDCDIDRCSKQTVEHVLHEALSTPQPHPTANRSRLCAALVFGDHFQWGDDSM